MILVLLMYLTGFALWSPGLRLFPLQIINLILIVLAAILWRPKSYSRLLLPFLGLGAALAVATLASPLPIVEGLIYWSLVALAYWFILDQDPVLVEQAIWLYSIALGLSGLLETIYMSAIGGELIRPRSLMDNPNLLGFVLIVALAVGTKRLQEASGKAVYGSAAALGLLGLLLLLTGSRASWAGVTAGVVVYIALSSSVRQRLFKPVPLIVSGVSALILLPLIINQLQHNTHGLLVQRMDLWRGALEAFLERPLLGYGPWTFAVVYEPRVAHPWIMFHSHNLVLNMGAETGLVGLAALAWLLVVAWRSAQRQALPVAYMVAILVVSLGDYAFWVPGAGLFVLAGWLVLVPEQRPYPGWGRVGFSALAVCTALAFAFRVL